MNRNLPPTLLVLAISALVGGARAAHAQRPEGLSPAAAVAESLGPVLLGSTPVTRPDATPVPYSPSPIAPVAIDWRMPSSNALIAGGVTAALIGLYVVKEEAGAGIAVAGAAAAVYGLYLRYR